MPPTLSRSTLPLPRTDAYAGENAPDRTPIVMVDERELLRAAGVDEVEPWWQPYSLQMLLKLLAFSLMVTFMHSKQDDVAIQVNCLPRRGQGGCSRNMYL